MPTALMMSTQQREINVTDERILNWINGDEAPTSTLQANLLDAAARAFTTHGYAAASIDMIAHLIGVTKGSVYYHYRNKADLFFAVHKKALIMNLRIQHPVVSDDSLDPIEKLRRMVYGHAMLMMDYFYYQRITVQGVELHQSASTTAQERQDLEQLIAMRDAYEDLFRRVLEEGIEKGACVDMNVRLAVRAILGALNWITVWYQPRETESDDYKKNVAEQLTRQVLFGVVQPQS
jgi:AcrR family transcriptional regulator